MSSYLNTSTEIANVRAGHVWRDDKGYVHGTVRVDPEGLSSAFLSFGDPATARAVAAACIACAEAMEALPPSEPENSDA